MRSSNNESPNVKLSTVAIAQSLCNRRFHQLLGWHSPVKAFRYYLGYQSSNRTSIPVPSNPF
jgi:hypothetical protein